MSQILKIFDQHIADVRLEQELLATIMDRIKDQVRPVIGTRVPGNDLGTAANNHLMNIAPDPDLLVAVGGNQTSSP